MCGIAGYLDLRGGPAPLDVVERMTAAIAHRGPSGSGTFVSGPVGLGHRRLAVLDLSEAAHQPMVTDDERFVISYNGEIYNHGELRIDLEATGHIFRSRSDTEVVLSAFAQWGEACVEALNGMFAFAVWDRKERKLFLARDRYGQKPLYCAFTVDAFLFGSEIKALLASNLLARDIDHGALGEYFTFQNIFSDRTLLSGVQMLPAGEVLTVEANGRHLRRHYWDFCFQPDPAIIDEREASIEVQRLLKQSVRRQLVADVDVGSYLSGGIDSSALATLAAKQLPHLRTFTCGFDLRSVSGLELAADEREAAESVSHAIGSEHYEVVLKAGDLERALPAVARAIEEPRVGQSYPNFYVAQLASKFNRIVLSGTGGDELFGGYPWRYGDADFIRHYWRERLLTDEERGRLLSPIWEPRLSPELDVEGGIASALHFECKTFLHGLLTVEDKLAMTHGLEVRFPMLDNDLVDFAMKIPASMKVKGETGKVVLREAVRDLLPRDVTDRKKRGFSAPDGSWFGGQSLSFVVRTLLSKDSRISAYVDRVILAELLDEHLTGKKNRRLLIWSLLSLEFFLRTYVP